MLHKEILFKKSSKNKVLNAKLYQNSCKSLVPFGYSAKKKTSKALDESNYLHTQKLKK